MAAVNGYQGDFTMTESQPGAAGHQCKAQERGGWGLGPWPGLEQQQEDESEMKF